MREGAWSVQLDLDALDLGSVAIQLHAGAEGIEGSAAAPSPPAVMEGTGDVSTVTLPRRVEVALNTASSGRVIAHVTVVAQQHWRSMRISSSKDRVGSEACRKALQW